MQVQQIKFEEPYEGNGWAVEVAIPWGGRILTVCQRNGIFTFLVLVSNLMANEPNFHESVKRKFYVVPNASDFTPGCHMDDIIYLGSVNLERGVLWNIFEVTRGN